MSRAWRWAGKALWFLLVEAVLLLVGGLMTLFGLDPELVVRKLLGEAGTAWLVNEAPAYLTHNGARWLFVITGLSFIGLGTLYALVRFGIVAFSSRRRSVPTPSAEATVTAIETGTAEVEGRVTSYDVQLRFDGTDYYERTKGSIRQFRVGIINNTRNRLENVSIHLDDCKDETGIRPEIDMPFGLQREEGLGPAPLSPNSPKYATVVQLDESEPDACIVIPRISSLKDTPNGYEPIVECLGRRKSYLLTVGAHPTTSAPHQMTFRVWVDSNGRLRMVEHI